MKIKSIAILGVFAIASIGTIAIAGSDLKDKASVIEPSLRMSFQRTDGALSEHDAILNSICHVSGGGMSVDPEQPISMICFDTDGNQIN